jgi:hypothetical protein
MPNTSLRVPQKQTINTPAVAHIRKKGFYQGGNRNLSIKPSGPTRPRKK